MQFALRAPAATQAAPFCLGFAFREGDIPAGSTVGTSQMALQVTPRTYWPDGSLKFAQIAGQADLAANTPVAVVLRRGAAAATGANLNTANLKATGITAEVGCGSFGTARWAAADWDQPFQTWVSGPLMSSWVFRKPVGTDPHLVAWLEVRLFAGGAVEVLPWIENGYLRVAGPTNKSAVYTFTLGATQRFSRSIDLRHHQRTPLIEGAALAYWLGNDPGVEMRHDALYLQATELVPSYRAAPGAAASTAVLAATFQPLQAGNFSFSGDYMPSSGYADPIGLLPLHDMLYLVANGGAEYAAVVRNGYSAGRYGIHYRDEATNRPIRFSQHGGIAFADGQGIFGNGSGASYTTSATGGNPPTWDLAHSPSVGFMAYLLTGRWYFMEEVQFAATANFMTVMRLVRSNEGNPGGFVNASGLLKSATQVIQTRASAWGIRTLAQALCVTPSSDALYPDLLFSMEENCRYFHNTYVAQPNNPYGFILPGEDAYSRNTRSVAAWQQDFVTAAWGYARAMGLPLSSTGRSRLAAFFDWKAKGTIFRLGPASRFWYVNANPYTAIISSAAYADYERGTGPWYATEAECYAATYPTNAPPMSNTEGVLGFDYGSANDSVTAMWGNLQPAIAYAVRFGVPGAREAYGRMTGATNWPAIETAFNGRPVWSVKPNALPTPAWLQGKPLDQWFQIPGTAGPGAGLVPNAFSDMTLRPSDSSLLVVAAGGHNDGSSNGAAMLTLADDAPAWVTLRESSTPSANVLYYEDGRPTSRHTYHHSHYIASLDAVLLAGCRFGFGGNTPMGPGMDLFGLRGKDYLARQTFPDVPSGAGYGVAQDGEGNIWTNTGHKFTVATRTWSKPGTGQLHRYPAVYNPERNGIFALQFNDGEGFGSFGLIALELNTSTGNRVDITFNASAARAQLIADAPAYAAMAYCPVDGKYYFLHPGRIGTFYVITPNASTVWDVETWTPAGTTSTAVPASTGPLCKRLLWVPDLKGFVLQADSRRDLYFIRKA